MRREFLFVISVVCEEKEKKFLHLLIRDLEVEILKIVLLFKKRMRNYYQILTYQDVEKCKNFPIIVMRNEKLNFY